MINALTRGNVAAQAPFCQHTARVLPSWIDYNGHMTEFRYLQVMSEASDVLLLRWGWMRPMSRLAIASTRLRPISDILLKPNWVSRSPYQRKLLSADEKRVHLWHACATD